MNIITSVLKVSTNQVVSQFSKCHLELTVKLNKLWIVSPLNNIHFLGQFFKWYSYFKSLNLYKVTSLKNFVLIFLMSLFLMFYRSKLNQQTMLMQYMSSFFSGIFFEQGSTVLEQVKLYIYIQY